MVTSFAPTVTTGIVVADAEVMLGSALASALACESDTYDVAHVATLDELLGEAANPAVRLVVVAADLPPQGGPAACRRLRARRPDLSMLLLAPRQDHETLVQALESGAQGLLCKDGRLAHVVAGVQAALRGEAVVPRRMLGGLLHELIQRRRQPSNVVERYARLSRREREVLGLLGQGLDHDGIARSLVISPQTARTHIQNVMGKLEVHSRVEAAAFAMDHGFCEEG